MSSKSPASSPLVASKSAASMLQSPLISTSSPKLRLLSPKSSEKAVDLDVSSKLNLINKANAIAKSDTAAASAMARRLTYMSNIKKKPAKLRPMPSPPKPRYTKLANGACPAPPPADEPDRLDCLNDLDIMDSEPEIAFDDITCIASHICGCSISFMTLIDKDRQWSKSTYGRGQDLSFSNISRDISFCSWAISGESSEPEAAAGSGDDISKSKKLIKPEPSVYTDKVYQIPDLSIDPRFDTNPLVVSGPQLRFYASAPMYTQEGVSALGTICVMDYKPVILSEMQEAALLALARLAVDQMEFRQRNEQLRDSKKEVEMLNLMLKQRNSELEAQVEMLMKDRLSILDTPAEKVISTLKQIQSRSKEEDAEHLDFVIKVIGSHRLYTVDVGEALDKDLSVDHATKNFLLTQFRSDQLITGPNLMRGNSVSGERWRALGHNLKRKPHDPSGLSQSSNHLLETANAQRLSPPPKRSTQSENNVKAPKAHLKAIPSSTSGGRAASPERKKGELPTAATDSHVPHTLTVPLFELPLFTPDQYRLLFKGHEDWGFDVFDFARMTEGRPLQYGMHFLFEQHELFTKFPIHKEKFIHFVQQIEAGYVTENPYHNQTHATDVLLACNYFFTHGLLQQHMDPKELMAGLIAAAIHDFRHPGLNNVFLINTADEIAILHNDMAVLENFHCAEAFKLLLLPDYSFLEALDVADRQFIRKTVINMVLGTDMAKHPEILNQFQNKIQTGGMDLTTNDDKQLAMRIAIKCADISNPARPPELCLQWTDRVMEEFFRQGDMERHLGLPVSAFMDRDNTDVVKCQIGFISFICMPIYKSWTSYAQLPEPLANLEMNLAGWKAKQPPAEPPKKEEPQGAPKDLKASSSSASTSQQRNKAAQA